MDVLIFDGTFTGLLTSIYEAYYSFPNAGLILSETNYCDNFLYVKNFIKTDLEKAEKVQTAIVKKTGILTLENIYLAFLSDNPDVYTKIFIYIKFAFSIGFKVNEHLYDKRVKNIIDIKNKITGEAHSFIGFIRFTLIDNKFLYSPIEPDNNILELLSSHFKDRFSTENFIIHDIKRGIALRYISDKNEIDFIEMNPDEYKFLKDYKDEFEDLWKTYFKYTTILERQNTSIQKAKMPKRYWKYITEVKNNIN
ncbi:TIGR03915 family putative DNA repair protein [Clostridium sp. 'White wine YQ']|uniref:TIGR03915 family putative DNA repair protein n=1 Tax=Clostridium sp. 'White wine YQ' TaxID=3027474 RepID=UPI0023657076|nr:TIGR03915 family putative DNA repair protein [Clostridium sp. 'White wine YQ']MDD7792666.1 TIGR03915 family putative DNA repair protein [Clostridium sp. 'White wine YQ']